MLSFKETDPLEACVVIPAYQAAHTVGEIVQGISSFKLPVIVVDDASTDGTAAVAETFGAEVVRRGKNGGKGAALREGLGRALRDGYRWILTMDADGQHLPAEISRFLQEAAGGQADVILGNRMGNPAGMPFERRLTNRWMSWFLSRIAGRPIPDSQCGFRMIRREVLEGLNLMTNRFEIESELVVKSIWAGFRLVSIPVSSVYHRNFSFVHPIGDTLRFFRFLFRLRRPRIHESTRDL